MSKVKQPERGRIQGVVWEERENASPFSKTRWGSHDFKWLQHAKTLARASGRQGLAVLAGQISAIGT